MADARARLDGGRRSRATDAETLQQRWRTACGRRRECRAGGAEASLAWAAVRWWVRAALLCRRGGAAVRGSSRLDLTLLCWGLGSGRAGRAFSGWLLELRDSRRFAAQQQSREKGRGRSGRAYVRVTTRSVSGQQQCEAARTGVGVSRWCMQAAADSSVRVDGRRRRRRW